jgi:hypothetical protein
MMIRFLSVCTGETLLVGTPLVEQLFDCELNRYGKSNTNNDTTKENGLTAKVIHNNAPFK